MAEWDAFWIDAELATMIPGGDPYGAISDGAVAVAAGRIAWLGGAVAQTVRTTFLGGHAPPPEYDGRSDDYIDVVVERMIPAVAEAGLADAEYRGRVIKTTGDGLLTEFAGVVDAVRRAAAFQGGMARPVTLIARSIRDRARPRPRTGCEPAPRRTRWQSERRHW